MGESPAKAAEASVSEATASAERSCAGPFYDGMSRAELRRAVANGTDKGIRDFLAEDRTILANERTFLAYLRTALTFAVAGLTLIKFFDSSVIAVLGWIFLPIGPITLVIGLKHYLHMRREIHQEQ